MHESLPYILYLLCVNLLALGITISDKKRAEQNRWRVPERTLLLISLLGGSPAMYITMRAIHHKTRRKKFMIGIPLLLILQCAFLVFLAFRFL